MRRKSAGPLRSRYGFKPSFDLEGALRSAATLYAQLPDAARNAEIRRQLDNLRGCVVSLETALSKLHPDARGRVIAAAVQQRVQRSRWVLTFGDDVKVARDGEEYFELREARAVPMPPMRLRALATDLARWRRVLSAAKRGVDDDSGGRPADHRLNELLADLIAIYETGTRKEPRASSPQSDLICFITDAMSYSGLPATEPSALLTRVTRLMQKRRDAMRQRGTPRGAKMIRLLNRGKPTK